MNYFGLLFGFFYQDTKGNKTIGISVNQSEILIVHVHDEVLPIHQLAVYVSLFTYFLTDSFCNIM